MQRNRITKSELRLIGVTVFNVAILLGIGLWWRRLNTDPVINIPTPAMPSPNAFDYYVKAAKAHAVVAATLPRGSAIDPVNGGGRGLSPQQLAQRYPTAAKVAFIRKDARAFQLLRQGFSFRYRQPPERSFPGMPPYSQFRELARLLVIESHARSERGDWAGACRSALDILHLGHDVPRGGTLIASLVGSAIDSIGNSALQDIVPHLDAATSRAAARQIEQLDTGRVTYAETLQEEKWRGQVSLHETLGERGWRSQMASIAAGSVAPDWRIKLRVQFLGKQRVFDNYTHYMDALIVQAKKPYTLYKSPPVPDDPVSAEMVDVFKKARWYVVRHEIAGRVLAVQLALRAFRLEHGAFPATLKALTPAYLAQVPLDPSGGAGEALHYRKTGNTYVLYAIGPDGKDDGGKAVDNVRHATASRPNVRHFVQPESKGDYVAGINR